MSDMAALSGVVSWLQATAPGARLISDSRQIGAGDVFLAYPGEATDGRSYISGALARGASAVLFEQSDFEWDESWQLPHRPVANLRQQIGPIANLYYGRPDADMFTVAVTGTNGKTSCSQWIGRAFSRLGTPTAVVGTLGVGLFGRTGHADFEQTGLTTPDAALLQYKLRQLADQGARALAIEASSIGLHQGRMNGLHVDVAVLTNFTRDHLDYHGDMDAYEAAKRILFDWPGLRHAVINLDDAMGLRLIDYLRARESRVQLCGYSLTGRAVPGVPTLQASDVEAQGGGTVFRLQSPFGNASVRTGMVGRFNVSNVLAILGVLLAKGIDLKTGVEAIQGLLPVAGRMQQVGGQDAPLVVIDYAHTPDALEQVLQALRPVADQRGGQLWCVFGCGGDRDPGKRPLMGAVSQRADRIVLTSDNPRSEEPAEIIRQIAGGMSVQPGASDVLQVIDDRAQAILWAVRHAGKNDVVLLAGKGHEPYQEIKGRKLPFLDADHAALALAARVTMKGMNS